MKRLRGCFFNARALSQNNKVVDFSRAVHRKENYICPLVEESKYLLCCSLFIVLPFFLAALLGLRDLISQTRDQIHALYSGSMESYLQDCQGSPSNLILNFITLSIILGYMETFSQK